MDLVSFHRNWLGQDLEHTPKDFQLTPQQVRLYASFPQGRGFSSTAQDPNLFLGTIIIMFAQIRPTLKQPVILITSSAHMEWVISQMRTLARYLIRTRKYTPGGVDFVRHILDQVILNTKPLQMLEPARWAAFGLSKLEPLPSWIVDSLIEVEDG